MNEALSIFLIIFFIFFLILVHICYFEGCFCCGINCKSKCCRNNRNCCKKNNNCCRKNDESIYYDEI